MEEDKRMVELLADMLFEIKGLHEDQERQTARMEGFEAEQRKTTNAILSLTSLLEKVIVEPARQQANDIADLKERVSRLEQAH